MQAQPHSCRQARTRQHIAAITLATLTVLGMAMPVAAVDRFDLPATQLRVTLDRALAEHAFLTLEAMRTGIEQGDAFAAAAEALEGNTVEVVGLIESVYGVDAADAFGDLWRAHIGYVVDYTRALADGDQAAQDRAVDQLRAYTGELAELLAGANPRLTVEGVQGLLEDHVAQLEQVAAFASQDYGEAYPAVRETYAHMFMIGDGLADAIARQFPERFTGRDVAFGPAVGLGITLDRLLGEHALLAILATRAGLTGAADRDEAVDTLDANSAELARAIGLVYGQAAGEAFADLWRTHVGYYLDYVDARREDDGPAMQDAADGLQQYRSDFSAFVADANPNLSASDLEHLLAMHTDHLIAQVDAFAEGDYEGAYTATREAYAHMGAIATALAVAIAAQFPDQFPDTAIPADHPAPAAWAGGAVLAMLGLVVAWRLRQMRLLR